MAKDKDGYQSGYDAIVNPNGTLNYWDPDYKPKKKKKKKRSSRLKNLNKEVFKGEGDRSGDKDPFAGREFTPAGPAQNFGYIDKPKVVSLAGMLPGVPGFAGKAVNAAINANNLSAVNKARDMIDLDPISGVQAAKSVAFDNKGQVADVNINDQTYSVGFEAFGPKNQTNLTPMEARARAQRLGMQEVGTNPTTTKPKGILGALKQKATEMFGIKPNEAITPTAPETQEVQSWNPEKGILGNLVEKAQVAVGVNPQGGLIGALKSKANETVFGTKPKADATMSPVDNFGYVSPEESPSGGMAALAPNGLIGGMARVSPRSYVNYERLQPDVAAVSQGIAQGMGGLDMTSGYRSKAYNAKVGGAKHSAHIDGMAFDYSTQGMTDAQKQKSVEMARLSGARRVGTYPDGSVHVDMMSGYTPEGVPGAIQSPDGTYGMYNRTAMNAAKNAPGWFTAGMTRDDYAMENNYSLYGAAMDQQRRDARLGENLNELSDLSRISSPNPDSSLPAGMRNYNPGNLKFNKDVQWDGLLGPSVNTDQGDPQAVFSSPELGMRAAAKLGMNKYNKGMKTANDLIAGPNGWTPGNYKAAANIAAAMGLRPDEDLGLADAQRMQSFMRGLVTQEHGPMSKQYTDDMISQGVRMAMGTTQSLPSANAPTPYGKFSPMTMASPLTSTEDLSPSEASNLARGFVGSLPSKDVGQVDFSDTRAYDSLFSGAGGMRDTSEGRISGSSIDRSGTSGFGMRSERTEAERSSRASVSSGYSGQSGGNYTGGSGRASSYSAATGYGGGSGRSGYSGASGGNYTGGSGRASSYGAATGTGGFGRSSSGTGYGHSSGGSYSSGASKSSSGSQNDRGGYSGL